MTDPLTPLQRQQLQSALLARRAALAVQRSAHLDGHSRAEHARELLLQTAMPIMAVSTACGFQSPPHFSKCYRQLFGHPPIAERQQAGSRGAIHAA